MSDAKKKARSAKEIEELVEKRIEQLKNSLTFEDNVYGEELEYEPEYYAYACPYCGRSPVEWNQSLELYCCVDCGSITKV
ncbi:MAG: hypothetical protein AB4368_16135 [Xenococcaceae cyanobacterium]